MLQIDSSSHEELPIRPPRRLPGQCFHMNIAIVGESGVGKSLLIDRFSAVDNFDRLLRGARSAEGDAIFCYHFELARAAEPTHHFLLTGSKGGEAEKETLEENENGEGQTKQHGGHFGRHDNPFAVDYRKGSIYSDSSTTRGGSVVILGEEEEDEGGKRAAAQHIYSHESPLGISDRTNEPSQSPAVKNTEERTSSFKTVRTMSSASTTKTRGDRSGREEKNLYRKTESQLLLENDTTEARRAAEAAEEAAVMRVVSKVIRRDFVGEQKIRLSAKDAQLILAAVPEEGNTEGESIGKGKRKYIPTQTLDLRRVYVNVRGCVDAANHRVFLLDTPGEDDRLSVVGGLFEKRTLFEGLNGAIIICDPSIEEDFPEPSSGSGFVNPSKGKPRPNNINSAADSEKKKKDEKRQGREEDEHQEDGLQDSPFVPVLLQLRRSTASAGDPSQRSSTASHSTNTMTDSPPAGPSIEAILDDFERLGLKRSKRKKKRGLSSASSVSSHHRSRGGSASGAGEGQGRRPTDLRISAVSRYDNESAGEEEVDDDEDEDGPMDIVLSPSTPTIASFADAVATLGRTRKGTGIYCDEPSNTDKNNRNSPPRGLVSDCSTLTSPPQHDDHKDEFYSSFWGGGSPRFTASEQRNGQSSVPNNDQNAQQSANNTAVSALPVSATKFSPYQYQSNNNPRNLSPSRVNLNPSDVPVPKTSSSRSASMDNRSEQSLRDSTSPFALRSRSRKVNPTFEHIKRKDADGNVIETPRTILQTPSSVPPFPGAYSRAPVPVSSSTVGEVSSVRDLPLVFSRVDTTSTTARTNSTATFSSLSPSSNRVTPSNQYAFAATAAKGSPAVVVHAAGTSPNADTATGFGLTCISPFVPDLVGSDEDEEKRKSSLPAAHVLPNFHRYASQPAPATATEEEKLTSKRRESSSTRNRSNSNSTVIFSRNEDRAEQVDQMLNASPREKSKSSAKSNLVYVRPPPVTFNSLHSRDPDEDAFLGVSAEDAANFTINSIPRYLQRAMKMLHLCSRNEVPAVIFHVGQPPNPTAYEYLLHRYDGVIFRAVTLPAKSERKIEEDHQRVFLMQSRCLVDFVQYAHNFKVELERQVEEEYKRRVLEIERLRNRSFSKRLDEVITRPMSFKYYPNLSAFAISFQQKHKRMLHDRMIGGAGTVSTPIPASSSEQPMVVDHVLRVRLLGAPGSGKTAFLHALIDDLRVTTYTPTTELDVATCVFELKGRARLKQLLRLRAGIPLLMKGDKRISANASKQQGTNRKKENAASLNSLAVAADSTRNSRVGSNSETAKSGLLSPSEKSSTAGGPRESFLAFGNSGSALQQSLLLENTTTSVHNVNETNSPPTTPSAVKKGGILKNRSEDAFDNSAGSGAAEQQQNSMMVRRVTLQCPTTDVVENNHQKNPDPSPNLGIDADGGVRTPRQKDAHHSLVPRPSGGGRRKKSEGDRDENDLDSRRPRSAITSISLDSFGLNGRLSTGNARSVLSLGIAAAAAANSQCVSSSGPRSLSITSRRVGDGNGIKSNDSQRLQTPSGSISHRLSTQASSPVIPRRLHTPLRGALGVLATETPTNSANGFLAPLFLSEDRVTSASQAAKSVLTHTEQLLDNEIIRGTPYYSRTTKYVLDQEALQAGTRTAPTARLGLMKPMAGSGTTSVSNGQKPKSAQLSNMKNMTLTPSGLMVDLSNIDQSTLEVIRATAHGCRTASAGAEEVDILNDALAATTAQPKEIILKNAEAKAKATIAELREKAKTIFIDGPSAHAKGQASAIDSVTINWKTPDEVYHDSPYRHMPDRLAPNTEHPQSVVTYALSTQGTHQSLPLYPSFKNPSGNVSIFKSSYVNNGFSQPPTANNSFAAAKEMPSFFESSCLSIDPQQIIDEGGAQHNNDKDNKNTLAMSRSARTAIMDPEAASTTSTRAGGGEGYQQHANHSSTTAPLDKATNRDLIIDTYNASGGDGASFDAFVASRTSVTRAAGESYNGPNTSIDFRNRSASLFGASISAIGGSLPVGSAGAPQPHPNHNSHGGANSVTSHPLRRPHGIPPSPGLAPTPKHAQIVLNGSTIRPGVSDSNTTGNGNSTAANQQGGAQNSVANILRSRNSIFGGVGLLGGAGVSPHAANRHRQHISAAGNALNLEDPHSYCAPSPNSSRVSDVELATRLLAHKGRGSNASCAVASDLQAVDETRPLPSYAQISTAVHDASDTATQARKVLPRIASSNLENESFGREDEDDDKEEDANVPDCDDNDSENDDIDELIETNLNVFGEKIIDHEDFIDREMFERNGEHSSPTSQLLGSERLRRARAAAELAQRTELENSDTVVKVTFYDGQRAAAVADAIATAATAANNNFAASSFAKDRAFQPRNLSQTTTTTLSTGGVSAREHQSGRISSVSSSPHYQNFSASALLTPEALRTAKLGTNLPPFNIVVLFIDASKGHEGLREAAEAIAEEPSASHILCILTKWEGTCAELDSKIPSHLARRGKRFRKFSVWESLTSKHGRPSLPFRGGGVKRDRPENMHIDEHRHTNKNRASIAESAVSEFSTCSPLTFEEFDDFAGKLNAYSAVIDARDCHRDLVARFITAVINDEGRLKGKIQRKAFSQLEPSKKMALADSLFNALTKDYREGELETVADVSGLRNPQKEAGYRVQRKENVETLPYSNLPPKASRLEAASHSRIIEDNTTCDTETRAPFDVGAIITKDAYGTKFKAPYLYGEGKSPQKKAHEEVNIASSSSLVPASIIGHTNATSPSKISFSSVAFLPPKSEFELRNLFDEFRDPNDEKHITGTSLRQVYTKFDRSQLGSFKKALITVLERGGRTVDARKLLEAGGERLLFNSFSSPSSKQRIKASGDRGAFDSPLEYRLDDTLEDSDGDELKPSTVPLASGECGGVSKVHFLLGERSHPPLRIEESTTTSPSTILSLANEKSRRSLQQKADFEAGIESEFERIVLSEKRNSQNKAGSPSIAKSGIAAQTDFPSHELLADQMLRDGERVELRRPRKIAVHSNDLGGRQQEPMTPLRTDLDTLSTEDSQYSPTYNHCTPHSTRKGGKDDHWLSVLSRLRLSFDEFAAVIMSVANL